MVGKLVRSYKTTDLSRSKITLGRETRIGKSTNTGLRLTDGKSCITQ